VSPRAQNRCGQCPLMEEAGAPKNGYQSAEKM